MEKETESEQSALCGHVLAQLAAKFPHFEIREGQLQMFQDVSQAYFAGQTLLIEAGTGTGKSLAYLIPAMLWAAKHKEPTVIATHTIALQEQLIQKDIPFLLQALELDLKAVLAKGMSNYVCLRKVHDNQIEIPVSLALWVRQTKEGSRSELPVIPSADLWEQIGAEADTCTYAKCPFYKECFFFKARAQAQNAHLIVANHHLLFADLAIREESEAFDAVAVLPPYKRLIIDEAHHCEDVATQYFAQKVSRRGFIHLLGRLSSDRGTGKLATLYRKILEAYPNGDLLAEPLVIILPAEKRKIMELVNEAFGTLSTYLETKQYEEKFRLKDFHLKESGWKDRVQPPIEHLIHEGKAFLQSISALEGILRGMDDPLLIQKCEGILAEIKGICGRLELYFESLHTFVFSPLEKEKVRWIEGDPPDLHLIAADLEVAPRLSKTLFARLPTIILCSATLSSNSSFSFIRKRLGIEQAEERTYPSPFNYQEQTLLSVPNDLPDPSHPSFINLAAEKIWEAIEVSRGGAFVLFTSYLMLKECENLLAERFYKKKYFLLCQGDENRSSLLQKFRNTDKAILFGTDSFWEGVDVAGHALRCVIIAKLPFKVPNDPLFEARSEIIAQQGGSPFFEYSLPHAIVKFKQGFGRLIRNREDRGCVLCLDSRLVTKGYGKKFLKSLPACRTVFENSDKCIESLKTFYYNPIKK
jgi:ATP-dependent DNA helicase DinG